LLSGIKPRIHLSADYLLRRLCHDFHRAYMAGEFATKVAARISADPQTIRRDWAVLRAVSTTRTALKAMTRIPMEKRIARVKRLEQLSAAIV
jgi:hypothetical protein